MAPTVRQRSQLLRSVILIAVILAFLATVGLVFEWINLTRGMAERRWTLPVIRLILLGIANLVFTATLAACAATYLWARMARSLPDLKGWHLESPESEFSATDAKDGYRFDDYVAQENRVFDELDQLMAGPWSGHSPGTFCRYDPNSVCHPETVDAHNWNRTRVALADNPIGGVLLLHGLSDSPYSVRALGERFLAEGYTVIWLRVPGHGTNPRALVNVSRDDWTAAVRVAMQGLKDKVPSGCPLLLCGYSNGGALSLNYAVESLDDDSLPRVSGIVLLSPMIGINPLAKVTWLYHIVGLVSRLEKTKWSSIFAEIDPFKYSSWPMNANVQAWAVTKRVERQLAKLDKAGRMHELPPVLAMQSVVDSTVKVSKLITVLFDRLESDTSELFLFDVNRMDSLSNLLNLSFEQSVLPKLDRADRPYRLTVMSNQTPGSSRLSLRIRDDGVWTEEQVDAAWPQSVVSLSHVAVPFPPDDPVYGECPEKGVLPIGSLQMRAEPNALMIPSSVFVRCRRNPFYGLMEDRVVHWLECVLDDTADA